MNSRLPHGLLILKEAAGIEAALKIALARGGSRMEIPQKAEGSILAEIVGIDAARKIVNDLAGERIEIPVGNRSVNDWLRENTDWSQEKRAVRLRVGRRTIQRWDAGNQPSMQPDLFDKAS